MRFFLSCKIADLTLFINQYTTLLFTHALKGSMRQANIISPSPTEINTSLQAEKTNITETKEPINLSSSYVGVSG